MMLMKINVPKMPIICLGLGAALAPTGLLTWLDAIGGAGISVMVFNAGGIFLNGILNILQLRDPSLFILVMVILVACLAIGVLADMLREAYLSHRPAKESE